MRGQRVERLLLGAAVALVAVAGIMLRFRHAGSDPLWLDEAYSAYAADRGFAFLWHVVPRYETHPPFYYSLVRLWSLATGDGLFARRLLGILAGIAALPLVAAAADGLARLLGWSDARRPWLVALATMLAAIHPFSIEMARQVRPYPVMLPVYALALVALMALAADARDRRPLRARWLVAVTLAEAAMLWLHSLGPLFGGSIALALAVLTLRGGLRPRDWAALTATQIAAALIYLPAFLILIDQAPTWVQSTWLRFRPAMLPDALALLYANWHRGVLWIVAAAGLAGAGFCARERWGLRAALALVILAVLPTAASVILSMTVSPVFLLRTLVAMAVPGFLLIAAGIAGFGRWRLAAAPVAGWLLLTDAAVAWSLAHQPPMQDWYGTIAWLAPRMRPGDVVWAYPNEGALPLGYALGDEHRRMAVRAIPAPVPAFGMGYYPTGSRGVVSLYPAQIAALVASPVARRPPTIWLLRLGAAKYDPGDALLDALVRTRTPVARYHSNQIDLIGLRRMP